MILFDDARRIVKQQIGDDTQPNGFEDATHYNVLLSLPTLNDTVYLVDKDTGELDEVTIWGNEDRLDAMTEINA